LDVFSDTFLATRPTNVNELHAFVMERAGLEGGQRTLDASCGFFGPGRFFETTVEINFDAGTISSYQSSVTKNAAREATGHPDKGSLR
jgi:hypothetical protein